MRMESTIGYVRILYPLKHTFLLTRVAASQLTIKFPAAGSVKAEQRSEEDSVY